MKKTGFAVLLLGFVGAVASVPASATSVLYNNTTGVSGSVSAYSISSGFSITDTFTLSSSATITGADFEVWLYPGDTLSSVDWSIGTSDFGGTATTASILTSTSLGMNFLGASVYDETISIPSLTLAAGSYWFTLQNAIVPSGDDAFWDESDGASSAIQQNASLGYWVDTDDGSLSGSQTFQILGATPSAVTPEPSSFLLLGSGLVGFAGMMRRKLKA